MDVLYLLYVIFLGAVQGITEFLPISSSAHLIIFSSILNKEILPLSLSVALHFGTALSLLAYFYKDWLNLIFKLYHKIVYQQNSFESNVLFPALIMGSLPAGVIGILWEDDIERLFHNPIFVTIPLIVVGILLWLIDKRYSSFQRYENLNIKNAFLIGIAQSIALIPGVSRSGITILAARILGYYKEDAAKFSFILAIPAVLGAVLLESKKIIYYINDISFYIGIFSSFITGCLVIEFFLRFLKKFGFFVFAIYRIILALFVIFWFLL